MFENIKISDFPNQYQLHKVKQMFFTISGILYSTEDKDIPFTGIRPDLAGTAQIYYKNGLKHREDGPAYVYVGPCKDLHKDALELY